MILLAITVILVLTATTVALSAAGLKGNKFIGIEKAKSIALDKYPNAEIVNIKLDYDDRRFEYEVTMLGTEYRYSIEMDAVTGKIIETDVDKIKNKKNVNVKLLTIDEVLAIIIDDAGVKKADIKHYKYDLDSDDGRIEYDVEVIIGEDKYTYEVDAVDGTIRDVEVNYK
jgi:Predicted membrane protein